MTDDTFITLVLGLFFVLVFGFYGWLGMIDEAKEYDKWNRSVDEIGKDAATKAERISRNDPD